jgi:hypothetical protein
LLELDPPPFGDLGRTHWARPDGAASHQAVIERLAVGFAFVNLDLGQAATGDWSPEHHTFGDPITREEAVHF